MGAGHWILLHMGVVASYDVKLLTSEGHILLAVRYQKTRAELCEHAVAFFSSDTSNCNELSHCSVHVGSKWSSTSYSCTWCARAYGRR